ncbi:hypothetical protein HD553DRAFT_304974 [Filobasidium floriforme]|uniref:uncharacterized protein n=1 Tax=Filobasidium floriforme TaxID=5210 RepID=UPI001E8DCB3E|nr:uncharacterized protein HD553DRAFT_304974 [Filobasidium floriforme]KAH8089024.1 hypothetical protein HD553DRAFT_304974 [Filobasidium floriforme]
MYIDIALTPAEETYLLSGFLILILLALVLLLRPRLFSRGLAPLLNFIKLKGLGAGVGVVSRRSLSSAGNGTGGMNGVFPLSMPSSKRDQDGATGTRRSSSSLGASLISGWNKRWQLIRKTIHDNPDDFGHGWASYWPIPTWSMWTTYPPVLSCLEDVFKDDLNLDLDVNSKRLSLSMEVEEEIVTPLEEGSRKGSVGLGIVGVDVVKPNPNSSSRSNSLVDPVQGSSTSTTNIKEEEGEETREEDRTEEKPVRDGFFPVNYAMTAVTMTTDPVQPPTSTSIPTSTSMLGAREPRSPSSTEMKSQNPNQSPGMGMGMTMGRRFTASSLHPDDHPKSQTQSPNADNISTSTSTEPMLIPFTPFPKPFPSTSTSTFASNNRSWASRARRLLLYTYTRLAGPVCLVAMGFALGVMVWQAGQSWGKVWRVTFGRGEHGIDMTGGEVGVGQTGTGMGGLGKRGVTDDQGLGLEGVMEEGYGYRPEGGNVVQALIPGWTVPFSHIVPIVGTLLVAQIIHEAGHVIAGAMDSIRPTRLALNLHLVVPAASVTFPKTTSDLVPSSRLRMAASGPWNNLLTWAVLMTIAATRMSVVFYHDYTAQGRVVLGIDSDSALNGHIPIGSIIEFLDDTRLSGERDTWSDYLLGNQYIGNLHSNKGGIRGGPGLDESRGWCIDKKRYLASLTPTTSASEGAVGCPGGLVEFTSLPSNVPVVPTAGQGGKDKGKGMGTKRCLPAYPLLTSRTWACPCSSASQVCVRPVPEERIMRIQWRLPRATTNLAIGFGAHADRHPGAGVGAGSGTGGKKHDEQGPVVVLWSGEKREIWETVRVSRWVGRFGTIGRWVVGWFELVFNYMATLSLSLALLNVLPLPRLDGAHMVEAVLDQIYPGTRSATAATSTTGAIIPAGGDEEDAIEQGLVPLNPQDEIVQVKRHRIERFVSVGSVGIVVMAIGGGLLASILDGR